MGDTNSPLALSDRTPVRLPMTLWFTTVAFAFAMGGIWFTLKGDVTRLSEDRDRDRAAFALDITKVKESNEKILLEVQKEQKMQGELLIRIDEQVKLLRK